MELDIWGCLLQIGAVFFEASRLAFTQKLLKDHKYRMDPLVSLYYFAPCYAAMMCRFGIVDGYGPRWGIEGNHVRGGKSRRYLIIDIEWIAGSRIECRVGAVGELFV